MSSPTAAGGRTILAKGRCRCKRNSGSPGWPPRQSLAACLAACQVTGPAFARRRRSRRSAPRDLAREGDHAGAAEGYEAAARAAPADAVNALLARGRARMAAGVRKVDAAENAIANVAATARRGGHARAAAARGGESRSRAATRHAPQRSCAASPATMPRRSRRARACSSAACRVADARHQLWRAGQAAHRAPPTARRTSA